MIVPALLAAGAGTVTALLAVGFGAARRAAILGGIALPFGTEILIYARTFHAETLASVLVGLVVWGSPAARATGVGGWSPSCC